MVGSNKQRTSQTQLEQYVVVDMSEAAFAPPKENEIILITPMMEGFFLARYLKEDLEQMIGEFRV